MAFLITLAPTWAKREEDGGYILLEPCHDCFRTLTQRDGHVPSNRVTQPLVGSIGYYLRVSSCYVVTPSLPPSNLGLDLGFVFHKACS